jgi:hypothetical protein
LIFSEIIVYRQQDLVAGDLLLSSHFFAPLNTGSQRSAVARAEPDVGGGPLIFYKPELVRQGSYFLLFDDGF